MDACWSEDEGACWWVAEDLCSHCQTPRRGWVILAAVLACWLAAIVVAIGVVLLVRAVLQATGVLP
jgi:hypothetical protein